MKMIVAALALLSFAAPAVAQESSMASWPKQDWRLLKVTNMSAQTPFSAMADSGARPDSSVAYNTVLRNIQAPPAGRQNIALDVSGIQRAGKIAQVRYFVWPDDKSNYTEVSSQIDCGRTGEQITAVRQYDRDFAYVGGGEQALRRTDATARAVAIQVCGAARIDVSGKSLPEIAKGG